MATQIDARARLRILAGAIGLLVSGCAGGESGGAAGPPPSPPVSPPPPPPPPTAKPLKQVYSGDFHVGAAIQRAQLASATDEPLLRTHFDTIVAEYEMKPDQLAPTAGAYNWTVADALVDYAQANNMRVRGHALVWHQTTPAWFLEGGDPAVIRQRLETYVTDVVTRYRGKVFAWDVVNEVASDNSGETYRNSPWFQAVGPDYIEWAFRAARAADPNCQLFINDYSTEYADKRARLMTIVNDLRAKNVPLDGVGHQFHLARNVPTANLGQALDDFAVLGLINHITELDVSAYQDPGSCYGTPPSGCQAEITGAALTSFLSDQARLYRAVFEAATARSSVEAVLVWGLHDAQSWLNSFPITRVNHPLLFDRQRQPKPAFFAVTDQNYAIP